MNTFGKYIGIQGVLAFLLVTGYVIAPFTRTTLPAEYPNFMVLILGYYLGKNGTSLLAAITGRMNNPTPSPTQPPAFPGATPPGYQS
jgi:hypothetical protein